ncbi:MULTISPECIES: diguanylate cyclase domain-containing protein [unclassified Caulobacter]|uniref:diguanylate cyclase domain-containing protein n=1 Tax=unclassified Caulobacter TaxID=2648921 RepID=UPI000D33CCD5|nr:MULTISPECIES: diguanylate cyclase [unclassified Caulobacter]PTS89189.1 GGDEF domain-containing protein [Caulobacter sp. HMWF009]PTT09992.1 GGDEF domain-containing protein [Caulobacter sp. HMWF025]
MAVDARILIVARDDLRAGPLSEGLDRLGWRTVTARGPYAALAALGDLPIEAVIVDLASAGPDTQSLARRLKAAVAPRRLPVIAIGEPDDIQPGQAFDLTLSPPLHPSQAALRLESLVRTAIAEEEYELRLQTFSERGRRMDLPEPQVSPFRILAVGEPAPQFLALSNALKRSGAEVVGAFTAYTAFDYLHERAFDSVVLWAGDNQQEALSIAAGMRRNTRLFHIPAMLYLKAESYVTMSEAFHRGVSDVASPETPEVETARRVMELARSYRRGESIRGALEKARSSGLMDAATGLFTRDLFAAHLAKLTTAAKERSRPLSICVLRVADKPETLWARQNGWLDRAIPQIGSMVGRLVRVEDTAARLAPEVFALALPATNQAAARAAAERIAAVIGCTAFDAGEDRPPFVCEFDIGVAQMENNEGAVKALERAAARALQREAG